MQNIPVKQFPDRSAKWLLSVKENVQGLFEILANDLVELLDFDQMQQVNTSF